MGARGRRQDDRRTDLIAWGVVIALVGAVSVGVGFGFDGLLRHPWPSRTSGGGPLIQVRAEAPPPPATQDDLGRAVRNPAWAVRPAPQYPDYAAYQGIESGEVELVCEALAEGRLGACRTVREDPAGYGFAAAADAAARDARLHPRQIDGAAVDSSIRFRIRFQMEDAAPASTPASTPD